MKKPAAILALGAVAVMTSCTTIRPPKSFLKSDDPRWQQCLADHPGFPSTELHPEEFQGALRIPWVHVHPDENTDSTTIKLPSTDVDQRTALWLYQQQTGAKVEILDEGRLEGTIRITWPGYKDMLLKESEGAKVEQSAPPLRETRGGSREGEP